MQPPSTEGKPISAVKMQRTTKSGNPGSTKKRDTSNGNETIGQKTSKSDNEESQVANLEKMGKTPLKAKGMKDSTKKVKAEKDKGKGNTPN